MAEEAVKLAARLFEQGKQPRWPMYIRQIRQYLRNADESFDEPGRLLRAIGVRLADRLVGAGV